MPAAARTTKQDPAKGATKASRGTSPRAQPNTNSTTRTRSSKARKVVRPANQRPAQELPKAPQAKEAPTGAEQTFMQPNPSLDRKIIVGMLTDRKSLMEELVKDGITEELVLKRAADCGVNDSLLRQVKGVESDLSGGTEPPGKLPQYIRPRQCLSCDRVFLSLGAGNRLCMRCRGGDAGLAAL